MYFQKRCAEALLAVAVTVMVAMPLLGWLQLRAAGEPIPFFRLQLPPLIGEGRALANQLNDVHETIGTIGYWLIGLHAAAALVHHYLMRDNTLVRMLPRRS